MFLKNYKWGSYLYQKKEMIVVIENIPIQIVKVILGFLILLCMIFGMIYANDPKIKYTDKAMLIYIVIILLGFIIPKLL